jgi:hypothetical protein
MPLTNTYKSIKELNKNITVVVTGNVATVYKYNPATDTTSMYKVIKRTDGTRTLETYNDRFELISTEKATQVLIKNMLSA